MARYVKEQDYTLKRNEIIDSAWRLIYTLGYDQMSIQHILDDLSISKGAFYHYFSSKNDLLEALVERLIDVGVGFIHPIIQNPDLNAIEKFRLYFDTAVRWKTSQKEQLMALLRGWYQDNNELIRHKAFDETIQRITPFFAAIIQQGVREGVFHVSYPEQASELILSLFQAFGNNFTRAFLDLEQERDPERRDRLRNYLIGFLAAYSEAMERILDVPPGSLKLMDPEMLDEWIVVPSDPAGSTDVEPAVEASVSASQAN